MRWNKVLKLISWAADSLDRPREPVSIVRGGGEFGGFFFWGGGVGGLGFQEGGEGIRRY